MLEFGGRRPYRFHDARDAASGRWELWMDAGQAARGRAPPATTPDRAPQCPPCPPGWAGSSPPGPWPPPWAGLIVSGSRAGLPLRVRTMPL